MKTIIATSLFALSLLTLGGCSTMQDSTSMTQANSPYDEAYVATIDQSAKEHGIDVHWVHPPTKRTPNRR